MTTLVFSLVRPNSQTQPTTHTEYPHTSTDGHALQVQESVSEFVVGVRQKMRTPAYLGISYTVIKACVCSMAPSSSRLPSIAVHVLLLGTRLTAITIGRSACPSVRLSHSSSTPKRFKISKYISQQRLDLFAWYVTLSRLVVGFRTHL